MDTLKGRPLCWLLCLVVGALATGCVSSTSSHREDAPGDEEGDREHAEQQGVL